MAELSISKGAKGAPNVLALRLRRRGRVHAVQMQHPCLGPGGRVCDFGPYDPHGALVKKVDDDARVMDWRDMQLGLCKGVDAPTPHCIHRSQLRRRWCTIRSTCVARLGKPASLCDQFHLAEHIRRNGRDSYRRCSHRRIALSVFRPITMHCKQLLCVCLIAE
jgi:hypothetical protein